MKYTLLLLLMVASSLVEAQTSNIATEEKPYYNNGIEYGYAVRNSSVKEVNSKPFSRYEVSLFATNKSECSRIILFSQTLGNTESDIDKLARFDCLNATGALLTSKTGSLSAKPMFVTARISTGNAAGKNVTENQKVQIGYYLRVGETVSDNVIFIVPVNEKPDVRVHILNRATAL